MKKLLLITSSIFLQLACFSNSSFAAGQVVDDVKIERVAVNGGVNSPNQGTSCLKIINNNGINPVPASCSGGWVAILNNSKELLSAVLTAKSTNANLWFYYDDASASQHCPGNVFTPCVVNVIAIR